MTTSGNRVRTPISKPPSSPFQLSTGLFTFLPFCVSVSLPPSQSHPYHKPDTVFTLASLPAACQQLPAASRKLEARSLRRRGAEPSTGHLPVFLAVILEPCLSRRTNTSLLQWFTSCRRRPLRVWILTKHFAILVLQSPSASSAGHGQGQLPPAIVALTFH